MFHSTKLLHMTPLLSRLLRDEYGQDLIEYALLTTFVGLAAIAVFDLIRGSIVTVYGGWNSSSNSHWQPQAPSGS